MATYETFAAVYDAVMDDTLYDKWTDFSLRHFPKGKKKLLELACGTGIQSVRFAQAGYAVTGLDLSGDMLKLAKKRATSAHQSIQFIEGKDRPEVEFFHTFNTLISQNKQIVISSDRHPNKLKELDERLTSRIKSNIMADIQPPDFETRVAILRKKAEEEGILIDNNVMEVIDLLAEKIKFNIRELDSALLRVISFANFKNQPITAKFAKEYLTDIFSMRDIDISCESVKKAVCKKYNIKITDIDSKKRNR